MDTLTENSRKRDGTDVKKAKLRVIFECRVESFQCLLKNLSINKFSSIVSLKRNKWLHELYKMHGVFQYMFDNSMKTTG